MSFAFLRRYWQLVCSSKRLIMIAVLWMIVAEIFGLVEPYLLKATFDLVGSWKIGITEEHAVILRVLSEAVPDSNAGKLLVVGAVLALVLGSKGVSMFVWIFSRRASTRLQIDLDRRLAVSSLEKLMSFSLGYHIREETGKKADRMSRGVASVIDTTWLVFFDIMPALVRIPVFLAFIAVYDWRVALLLGVFVPITAWHTLSTIRSMKGLRQRRQDMHEKASAHSYEALANVLTVQMFGQEGAVSARLNQLHGEALKCEWEESEARMRIDWQQEVLRGFTYVLVIALCLYSLEFGAGSVGLVVMILMMQGRLVSSVQMCVRSVLHVGASEEPMVRFLELLERRSDVPLPEKPLPIDDFRGAVTFEHVNFAYPEADGVLNDVSIAVAPGEMLAVVGPSGGGKSTLVRLILRAFDVDAGRILIDGKDLREIDLANFRRQISVVPQSVDLFSATVSENIAFGLPNATREQIEEAARQASAHDFIVQLPDGYDTRVGERGVTLSGGQIQRIGIARAIIRNPRILILDEATSHLDVISEAAIQEAMENVRRGRTTIVIAHRLSTIAKADRILVLERGKIVEMGTRSSLERKNGLFKRLVDLQAAEVIRE